MLQLFSLQCFFVKIGCTSNCKARLQSEQTIAGVADAIHFVDGGIFIFLLSGCHASAFLVVCFDRGLHFTVVSFCAEAMASGHSGSAWSDADEERLQALLKLRAAAKAPIPLMEDAGAMGAMTDGSKRRLDVASEADSFSVVGDEVPFPDPGNHLRLSEYFDLEHRVKHLLPEGVKSFGEWGRTIFEFGKLQGSGMAYGEAMKDPEMAPYIQWCRKHLTKDMSGGPSSDFGCYLRAYDVAYGPSEMSLGYYPGTKIARKLK